MAELASFTAAAADLGLSKAAVSEAVRALEARLGVRLLHRTTRRVRLTAEGAALHERGKALLADVDALETAFQESATAVAGRVRVDMPSGFARNVVVPRLPELLAEHPRLELELGSADRRVDVVREGFDCVLRVGAPGDPELVSRPLGALELVSCASPAYLARSGTPSSLRDLARHQLVHYAPVLGAKPWGFEAREGAGYRRVPMRGAVTVNGTEAYEAACLAGLGIAQVPEFSVRAHLAAGRLVEILPGHRAEPMPVALLYPHRRQLPRRVRVFMGWLERVFQEAVGAKVSGPVPAQRPRR